MMIQRGQCRKPSGRAALAAVISATKDRSLKRLQNRRMRSYDSPTPRPCCGILILPFAGSIVKPSSDIYRDISYLHML
jgi:hypothetical protein